MRATRRTFRTAAIATGAIAALAVPTTAAFAADAPSTPHGQVAQDDQSGTQDQTGQDQNQDQSGKDQDKTNPDENKKDESGNQDKSKDETGKDDTGKDQTGKDDTGKDTTDPDKDKPVPGSWESKGTTDLGKGWTANVQVNASARTAKATISLNGSAKGSLTAYEKSASTTIDGNTFTLTPDGTATAKLTDKDKDKDKPIPGGWESKGTTNLGKGWTAKVDVNASARTAKASISLNGSAKGSLTAYAKSATTKIDGNTFTLTPTGTITMQAKPTPPKPKPDHKRVFVREYKNLGGSGFDAKVYKVTNGYEADMLAKSPDTGKKTVWDTLKQSGNKAAYGQHNGAHFVLNPDGTMKGWVEGNTHHHNNNGTKPQPHPRHDSQQVVPKGGVKAGADGVKANSSDDAPLIAAGSGMAAIGAAGLGFAMYRRKQNG
ncbi:hypothetical protein ABZ921_25625 [Streptomyces atriruber]|uniref:LPXTG cell wall anchor domain-containing protein n=1 Tax=Streptomyces atriruber TaxID=545121 RepID=A0ABV3BSN9_9ACTN